MPTSVESGDTLCLPVQTLEIPYMPTSVDRGRPLCLLVWTLELALVHGPFKRYKMSLHLQVSIFKVCRVN
jgi:hypothetical protein